LLSDPSGVFVLAAVVALLAKALYELGRKFKLIAFRRRVAPVVAPIVRASKVKPLSQTGALGARAWDWKAALLAGEFDISLKLTPAETRALVHANFLGDLRSIQDVRFVLDMIRSAQSSRRSP
jgi:hypothetical protein